MVGEDDGLAVVLTHEGLQWQTDRRTGRCSGCLEMHQAVGRVVRADWGGVAVGWEGGQAGEAGTGEQCKQARSAGEGSGGDY